MGKVIQEGVTPSIAKFMAKQPIFFVGTANSDPSGHINVSPKAPGCSLQVFSSHTVAYADLSGSGAETAAHTMQNQRICILFVNLDPSEPPRMVRLHGKARLVLRDQAQSTGLVHCFPPSVTTQNPGWRCIFVVDVDRVSTSCGYSMPKMKLEGYRNTLNEVSHNANTKGYLYKNERLPNGMRGYRQLKNSYSIDRLPSVALLESEIVVPRPEGGYVLGGQVAQEDERIEIEGRIRDSRQFQVSDKELCRLVSTSRDRLPISHDVVETLGARELLYTMPFAFLLIFVLGAVAGFALHSV